MGSTSSNEKMCWRKVDNSCQATDGSYCLVHFSLEDDSMDNSIELPLILIDLRTDRKGSCDQIKFK